jgi:hypothetical protein
MVFPGISTADRQYQDTTINTESAKKFSFAIIALAIFWIILGFAAFITSIICFGRSGSIYEKIIGLLLAIFFGPFYFLFYAFNAGYCR